MVEMYLWDYYQRHIQGRVEWLLDLMSIVETALASDEVFIEETPYAFFLYDKYGSNLQSFYREQIKMYLVYLFTPLIDLYLLGRLFKWFEVEGDEPAYAENVVIYIGQEHAKMISRYLRSELFFEAEFISRRPRGLDERFNQCQNIEGLPYPLFS
jgi:hypothetical protein